METKTYNEELSTKKRLDTIKENAENRKQMIISNNKGDLELNNFMSHVSEYYSFDLKIYNIDYIMNTELSELINDLNEKINSGYSILFCPISSQYSNEQNITNFDKFIIALREVLLYKMTKNNKKEIVILMENNIEFSEQTKNIFWNIEARSNTINVKIELTT